MPLLVLPLRRASDVMLAREKAGVAATLFGFDSVSQIRIATAASELARAIIELGAGGELSIEQPVASAPSLGLTFRSRSGRLIQPDSSWDPVRAAQLLADSMHVGSEAGWPVVARFVKHAPGRVILDEETLAAVLAEDADGEAIGALTRQNRQLARVLGELHAVEARQRADHEALAIYAHDLRSPLTAIMGALEQLEDGALTVSQARFLAIGRRAAGHLRDLTASLQDSALLDAGMLHLTRHPLALADVVASARGAIEEQADAKRVPIEVEVPAALGVDGDFARLTQIVVQLLSNAVKFSPPGAPITVRAVSDGRRALLGITDRGVGIPAAHLDAIFDKHARATARTLGTQGERGSGLGLALSRQLAALHGGTVTVASTPHVTTFTLALPLRT